MDERISEYELEGELIPTYWCWFFVIGFLALLTGSVWVGIIAVAAFAFCVIEDIVNNTLFSSKEAIHDEVR